MPAMRGDELTNLLMSEPRFKNLPIIICSNVINMSEVAGLMQSGILNCLPKSFDRERKLEALAEILPEEGAGRSNKDVA